MNIKNIMIKVFEISAVILTNAAIILLAQAMT